MLDSLACPLLDGREKPAPACKALLLAALPPAVQLALEVGWPGLPLLGSPNTELLAGAVHLGGGVLVRVGRCPDMDRQAMGRGGEGRKEAPQSVFAHPWDTSTN